MPHQEPSTSSRTPLRNALPRALATAILLCSSTSAWAVQVRHHRGGGRGGGGGPVNAPEIDPDLMLSALVLLVGGVLILSSRRRRFANPSHS